MSAVRPGLVTRARRTLRTCRGPLSGLAAALAAWALSAVPLARGVEDWVLDGLFFYRGGRPTTARVVLVGLDEDSLRETTKPTTHLSPELAAVARYAVDQGATAVGLDLLIPREKAADPAVARHDGPGEAWSLGQVVFQSRKVVLPVRGTERGPLLPLEPWWWLKRSERPEATDFGFTDLDEDGDQFVRRQRLLLDAGDAVCPHFALALYARSRGEDVDRDPATGAPRVGGRPVRTDPDGRVRINFVGPPGTFPVVPFRDVLAAARGDAGRAVPDLRGAVVVVGVTARAGQDYHATPYANHYARYEAAPAPGRMSGPELHAHVFATVADGAYVTTPRLLSAPLLLAVTGLALGVGFARVSLELGLLLAVAHHFAWKAVAFALFAGMNWRIEVTAVLLAGALAYAAAFAVRWRRLRRMFGVVKSEAVARALEADPDRLDPGGEERIVSVLFADIRDFTAYSERHAPAEVVAMLNAYFAAVVPCVEAEGGTVMSYMGDGIMALFGAPATQPDHAERAARAAAAMARAVRAGRGRWAAQDRAGVWPGGLRIGVGVHTGPAVVGAIGSPGRVDYSAIGDTTNVAARLEGATKELGAEVLLSAETAGRLPPAAWAGLGVAKESAEVAVKGKAGRIRVHVVTA